MHLLRSRAASSRPRACTGSSKHILAPCTLHALDSSLGSDARRSVRLASPRSTRSWRARRVECTCRVRRPDGRWAAHSPPIRHSPGLAHRPWLEQLLPGREAPRTARRSSRRSTSSPFPSSGRGRGTRRDRRVAPVAGVAAVAAAAEHAGPRGGVSVSTCSQYAGWTLLCPPPAGSFFVRTRFRNRHWTYRCCTPFDKTRCGTLH